MERKLRLLLLAVMALASSAYAKNAFDTLPENSFGMAVSPNGRYVVGVDLRYSLYNQYMASFIYDTEYSQQDWITAYDENDLYKGGMFSGVSNEGIVCGSSKDPNLIITFNDYDGVYTAPANCATVWKDGEATKLEYGDFDKSKFTYLQDGTEAVAISADGKKVAGNFCMGNGTYALPCVWNENGEGKWTVNMLPMPEGVTNAETNYMSADGNMIVGTVTLSSNQLVAAYWKDGICNLADLTKMGLADDSFIQMSVKGISANGRFMAVIVNYRSYWIVDLENRDYRLMPTPDANKVVNDMTVDDNGNVLSAQSYSMNNNVYARPFVYSYAENRLFDLSYYVNVYAPNLEISPSLAFEGNTTAIPKATSAGGNVIMGNFDTWMMYGQTPKCWVLQLDKTDIDIPATPTGVTGQMEELGQVRLTWNKDTNTYKDIKLKSYNIYRDGTLTASLDASESKMEIVQTNVPSGHPLYEIEGVYIKGDGTQIFSPKSTPCVVAVPSSYALPLFDDFESLSLQTNFWDNVDGVWTTMNNGGIAGGYIRDSETTNGPHSTSLVTRKLDATNQSSVSLSFVLIYGLLNGNDWPLDQDSLSVEYTVDDGKTWKTKKEWTLADLGAPYNWSMQHLDLTNEVAGKMFMIRLRNHGQGKAQYDFAIDNFKVGVGTEAKAAQGLIGSINDKGDKVSLAWKNSKGAYSLSHSSDLPYATMPIGNNGKEIIAANKFDASDLKIYQGKYLSGVSAYLQQTDYGSAESNKIHASAVVFEDGKPIREQEIKDIKFNNITTVALEQPVEIDPSKELIVGVKIFDYSENQYPLIYIQTNNFIAGKSDLYSEDGGTTWNKVSDEYPEESYGKMGYCAWYIAGCVTDEPTFEPKEDEHPFGYNLFRNGEVINHALINDFKAGFTDLKPEANACYDVVIYYLNGDLSEHSEQVCMDDFTSVNPNEAEGIGIKIKCDNKKITINGNFTQACLITTNGVVVAQSSSNVIPTNHVAGGIYLLQVEKNNRVATYKIVVKH